MDNLETRARLDIRHRTKANNTKNTTHNVKTMSNTDLTK